MINNGCRFGRRCGVDVARGCRVGLGNGTSCGDCLGGFCGDGSIAGLVIGTLHFVFAFLVRPLFFFFFGFPFEI